MFIPHMTSTKMKMNIFLTFFNSYVKECTYAKIFVMGDLNAEISDDKSLFGQHLKQFCHDSKLILSSMKFLPVDSYT